MTRYSAQPFIRKGLLLVLSLLLCTFSPPTAVAQEFNLHSDTMIRLLERDTVKGTDKTVLPVYEYLRVDYTNDPAKKIVFHAYGWGRGDLTDSGYFDDTVEGELIYGYLEYRPTFQNAAIRVGRVPIYSGIATDAIDGIDFSSNLGDQFSIALHAGQPVGYSDVSGRSGDLAAGGRIGYRHDSRYRGGLSYQLIRNDSDTVENTLAIDLNLALPADLVFDALTSFNLDTSSWAEQNYSLRFNLLETDLKLFFETFAYDDYFSSTPSASEPFQSSLAGSGETLSRYGLYATHPIDSTWETGIRLTGYDYDVKNDSAYYAAALLTWRGEGLQQIGGELGYLDANVIDNDQLMLRLFVYWDQLPPNAWLSFVSGDIVYAVYDKDFPPTTVSTSFFTSLGGGKTFLDERLQLKLSGDYSSDPYFDNDLRGILSLSYRYQN